MQAVQARRAFTLIELLVVMAIIAILAALLLPVLSVAKEKTYRTQCINNFKQLAVAIQTYADDHGDQLPGPVWQGFYENYDNQDYKRLLYYIATYLGLPGAAGHAADVPLARCPSAAQHWTAAASDMPAHVMNSPLSYIVSVSVTNINSGVVTPAVWLSLLLAAVSMDTNEAPKLMHEIANPTLSWA